jgi:hypothetical protein
MTAHPSPYREKPQPVANGDPAALSTALAAGLLGESDAPAEGLEEAMAQGGWLARLPEQARALVKMLGEMLYGATVYDMVRDLNKERGMIERLFILVVFGDVLGVPILPPYYALRLLPYVVPNIRGWRHSMLRERDLTDLCDQEFT